mmetsp:Transcript_64067/g.105764  ORF Transcript_64067/g.105764 Transcript_64067/m.105764 type:complete len:228 (-) Transcript_64067:1847-2530(-)
MPQSTRRRWNRPGQGLRRRRHVLGRRRRQRGRVRQRKRERGRKRRRRRSRLPQMCRGCGVGPRHATGRQHCATSKRCTRKKRQLLRRHESWRPQEPRSRRNRPPQERGSRLLLLRRPARMPPALRSSAFGGGLPPAKRMRTSVSPSGRRPLPQRSRRPGEGCRAEKRPGTPGRTRRRVTGSGRPPRRSRGSGGASVPGMCCGDGWPLRSESRPGSGACVPVPCSAGW